MITIPTVGWHDVGTKQTILQEKGAVPSYTDGPLSYAGKPVNRATFNKVKEVWPDSSMYEIVNRNGERQGHLWYMPIDLGDNVKLDIYQFVSMVEVQYGVEDNYGRDDLIGYLKALIGPDVELYKLMVKMGRLNQ